MGSGDVERESPQDGQVGRSVVLAITGQVFVENHIERPVQDVFDTPMFSNDAQQRYLYVADGMNKVVWIVQRDNLTPVSHFGEGGRYPGRFYAVGSVAVDSKGNVYTGEDSDGKRVQKWINKGMGPAQLN